MNLKLSIKNIFEAFIIILIIVDLVLLMFVTFSSVNQSMFITIIYFDLLVCIILFFDFVHRMQECEDKKLFFKKNWPDIIAMIPLDILYFSPVSLPPNYMFIARLFRFARLITLFRREWKYVSSFFKQTHINFAIGMLLFTMFAGTILFYLVEHGTNPDVHSLGDAMWFTITTMIAGNSNIVPITYYGEGISVLMMVIGISFVGILTASLASWLINKSTEDDLEKNKLEDIEKKLKNIKTDINELKQIERSIIDIKKDINELKNILKNDK